MRPAFIITTAAIVGTAAIIGTVATAHADRFEASIAGEAHAGIARIGEPGATAATVPAFGASARVAHAWRNTLAWDLRVGGTLTQPATFPDAEAVVNGRIVRGDVTRRTITTDLTVGAELRLGPRLIPTIRLGLGPQLRYRTASDIAGTTDGIPSAVSLDAVASLGLGVELRLGRHRVIGLVIEFDHAQPLGAAASHDVIALTVRVSRYWYPRWWSPSW